MKKITNLLSMALLMLCMGLTSCDDVLSVFDNPVENPNPLAAQVSGLWWTLIDTEGTLPEEFEAMDYTRMGMAYKLNEDGTGYGVTFFFNNEQSNPIQVLGGEFLAPMTYTTTTDGRIITTFSEANKAYSDYYKQFTATYSDGVVTVTNGERTLTLEHPSEAMAAKIREWDMAINGGFEMTSFNPNDVDFNHDTWRKQTGIYLYDGVGPKVITNNGMQYRFTGVELPWNAKSNNSNLPMNFCNDITPENGWDLVMNYCGDTSETNRNFFALYNKWTGVLRFFTYVPKGFESGNDHLWEVIINGQAGLRQGLPYGLPLDKTVTNPSAIGMDVSGSSHFVSPWVATRSTDGLITPRAGWWAFDVDMSQYQPNLNMSNDMIRLQMLSWKKQQANFFSEMTASLDGSISAEIKTELTKKASQLNTANEAMQVVMGTAASIGDAATGNFGSAFAGVGGLYEHLFTLAGKNESTTTFSGSINMSLKGKITTSGVLSNSEPVVGVSSPTISFSTFDTKNTQLGRGVWNLKTSPVVRLVGGSSDFQLLEIFWKSYNSDLVYANNGYGMNYNVYFPRTTGFYFFDPSSIEVELNPDLFPASQVEWTQVNAYCVSRAENGVKGTDTYRKAFGLKPRYDEKYFFSEPKETIEGSYWQMSFDDVQNVYDFLYYSDDKMGMSYPSVISTPKYSGGIEWVFDGSQYVAKKTDHYYDAVVGRGKAGKVAFEPMALLDSRNDVERQYRTPALEVMVCLTVKVKGQSHPYSYVRYFLPEIELLTVTGWNKDTNAAALSNLNKVWQNLKTRQPKGSGINRKSPTYDYEMMRIGKILNFLNPDFKAN